MSVATQITRLQGVRDQIRTKMVGLGLSSNTDLLQDLANDLDGVSKISPTNNGTTDPGTSYTNVDTLSRSTSTRYIKVPKGYNDADRKFTVSGVANGSVSSATTTDPGTSYTNQTTVTPSGTSAQYVKITAGYLPNSKITVSKMADGSISSATTTNPGDSYANRVTVTPSGTSAQYIKISKGYLPDGKITINKMAAGSVASATTTNPGDSYANQTTVTPSGTDAQYVKISAGYLPNSKITINKMASGSVSSASTTDPGTDYTNKTTVTPSLDKQYVKLSAGYLPNSKITVNAIPNQKTSSDVTASVTAGVSNITSINASQVTDGVTVTASASGSTVVPVGYYSTQVSKTPGDSKSTTIKPKLAGTNGAIELTAGTSAFTKTSTADYSNGFITSVKVNPTPSETKEYTPTMKGNTVYPDDTGRLLSSVTVKGVPYFSFNIQPDSWKSDSNATIGKYYYNAYNINITASNNLYVMPSNASKAQSFGVYAYSQSRSGAMGLLQFRAMERPTSDLTYTVYYLN